MTTTPTFQTNNLSSNRSDALPPDTLQLVLFYDGDSACAFGFETQDARGALTWTWSKGIKNFGTEIRTEQFAMRGASLTGRFTVEGVQGNGVVDGLAFGVLWRDAQGSLHDTSQRVRSQPHSSKADGYIGWRASLRGSPPQE